VSASGAEFERCTSLVEATRPEGRPSPVTPRGATRAAVAVAAAAGGEGGPSELY